LRPVSKPDRAMMPNLQISTTQNQISGSGRGSIDQRIRAFLNGESHGQDVLRALYGDVAEEPIPERLRGLLKS
jgi:hypothetical protein